MANGHEGLHEALYHIKFNEFFSVVEVWGEVMWWNG
jgi:hypothetical protein